MDDPTIKPKSINIYIIDLMVFFCRSRSIFSLKVSVQFSCSVVSDSLWPHGLQHAWAPCPSPTPGVYSNPCPLSWWCHPTISSSVVPFSYSLQSFPASGSCPKSWCFTSAGQNIGASAFSISLSNQFSGLISFRINWLYLLAVQRTLNNTSLKNMCHLNK